MLRPSRTYSADVLDTTETRIRPVDVSWSWSNRVLEKTGTSGLLLGSLRRCPATQHDGLNQAVRHGDMTCDFIKRS